jgi:hypothetical protein
LAELTPAVVPRLAELFGSPWHAPVRVDAVWVGRREGAYTVLDPDHITVSTTAANISGWTAAEIMLHEASHLLVGDLAAEIDGALGERSGHHRQLWHVVLFYLTGKAVQEQLRTLAGSSCASSMIARSAGTGWSMCPTWMRPGCSTAPGRSIGKRSRGRLDSLPARRMRTRGRGQVDGRRGLSVRRPSQRPRSSICSWTARTSPRSNGTS